MLDVTSAHRTRGTADCSTALSWKTRKESNRTTPNVTYSSTFTSKFINSKYCMHCIYEVCACTSYTCPIRSFTFPRKSTSHGDHQYSSILAACAAAAKTGDEWLTFFPLSLSHMKPIMSFARENRPQFYQPNTKTASIAIGRAISYVLTCTFLDGTPLDINTAASCGTKNSTSLSFHLIMSSSNADMYLASCLGGNRGPCVEQ